MASNVRVSASSSVKASGAFSYSGLGAPSVSVAQGNAPKRVLVIMASDAQFSERRKKIDVQEPKTIKKEILARLIASGAALASSANATLAGCEETSAAEQIARKADELPTAGKKLFNSVEIAQQAGSETLKGIQDESVDHEGAPRKHAEAKQRPRVEDYYGIKKETVVDFIGHCLEVR